NIISQAYVKKDTIIPMNYHFTTSKAHITLNGGIVEEVFVDEALNLSSKEPYKGNMDVDKLRNLIETHGRDKVSYVRIEAGTNLIGRQPHSLKNMKEIRQVCDEYDIMLVYDASLL